MCFFELPSSKKKKRNKKLSLFKGKPGRKSKFKLRAFKVIIFKVANRNTLKYDFAPFLINTPVFFSA